MTCRLSIHRDDLLILSRTEPDDGEWLARREFRQPWTTTDYCERLHLAA